MASRSHNIENDRASGPSIQSVSHASFRGFIGVARADITPPVEIYARNWGAARHDVAESIHRPLTLTALTLAKDAERQPQVLVDADLGWWRSLATFRTFQTRVLNALSLDASSLIFALSHTHAAVILTENDPELPGSELLDEYLQHLTQTTIETVGEALHSAKLSTLDWHTGRCQLASDRDLRDPSSSNGRIICGYDPSRQADDTLVVGRVTDTAGKTRASLVNYACHPTTLAWQNTAISPDFIGAMRETIEASTDGAPAIFLQGASGDLAPRYQYVGDPGIADRHGRQLAFAALATLEDMDPPATRLVYDRVVNSGAPLATWRYEPLDPSTTLLTNETTVDLPLKNWPTAKRLEQQRQNSEDRAAEERLRRQRDIRRGLGDGDTYALPLHTWRIGDVVLVGSMVEAYSFLQLELRQEFPELTVVCLNLINGSIGYLPPADLYDVDVYQVAQTPFDRGSLEAMVDAFKQSIRAITTSDDSPEP